MDSLQGAESNPAIQLRETWMSNDGWVAYFDCCSEGSTKDIMLWAIIEIKKSKKYHSLVVAKVTVIEFKKKKTSAVSQLKKHAEVIECEDGQSIQYQSNDLGYLTRRSSSRIGGLKLSEIWNQGVIGYNHMEQHSRENLEKIASSPNRKIVETTTLPNISLFNGLEEESNWFIGMRSQMDDIKTKEYIIGVTVPVLRFACEGASIPFQTGQYNVPSAHYLFSGSANRDWLITHSDNIDDLNSIVQIENNCPMSILHRNHILDSTTLEKKKIPHQVVRQGACDLIILFSEANFMCLDAGKTASISKSFWFDAATYEARSVNRCRCDKPANYRWLHQHIYESEKYCHMTRKLKYIPDQLNQQRQLIEQQVLECIEYHRVHGLPFPPPRLANYGRSPEEKHAEMEQNDKDVHRLEENEPFQSDPTPIVEAEYVNAQSEYGKDDSGYHSTQENLPPMTDEEFFGDGSSYTIIENILKRVGGHSHVNNEVPLVPSTSVIEEIIPVDPIIQCYKEPEQAATILHPPRIIRVLLPSRTLKRNVEVLVDRNIIDDEILREQRERYQKAEYDRRMKARKRAERRTESRIPKRKKCEKPSISIVAEPSQNVDQEKAEEPKVKLNKGVLLTSNRQKQNHAVKDALEIMAKLEKRKSKNEQKDEQRLERKKARIRELDEAHILLKVIFSEFDLDLAQKFIGEFNYTCIAFLQNFISGSNYADQLRFWEAVKHEVKSRVKSDYEFLNEIIAEILPPWKAMFGVALGRRVAIDDPAEFNQMLVE